MFIVDCDCYNYWMSAEVLLPYLDGFFKDYFVRGELPGPAGAFPHGHRHGSIPRAFSRADIKPRTQDEHLSLMRDKHLDRYKINCAILTGDEAMEASDQSVLRRRPCARLQRLDDRLVAAQGPASSIDRS